MDFNSKKLNVNFWNRTFRNSDYDYKSLVKCDWSGLVEWLKKYKVSKVLDLGCGYGHWSVVLAKAGFDVYAIDISKDAIKILKRWCIEEGLVIKYYTLSGTEIYKLKVKFDAIICNSVLDHMLLKDVLKTIENIHKLLKPKGVAYISFDGREKENPEDFVVLQDGTQKYIRGKHKDMLWRYYTDNEIKNLLQKFKILSFKVRKNGKRDIWVQK